MSSIPYYNQSAPFWDFVAEFEARHPNAANGEEATPAGEQAGPNPRANGWAGFPFRPMGHRGWGGPGHRHHRHGPPATRDENSAETLVNAEKQAEAGPSESREVAESDAEKLKDGEDNPHGPGPHRGGRFAGRGRGAGACRGRGMGGPKARHCGGAGSGENSEESGPEAAAKREGGCGRGRGGPGGRGRGGMGPRGRGFRGFPFAAFGPRAAMFLNQAAGNNTNADGEEVFTPDVDVFDAPESFIIHVSLPGAKKDDTVVEWDAEKSEITISGLVNRPVDKEWEDVLAMSERKVGVFERKVRLGSRANPAQVDVDGISAKMEDGILRVEVPKLDSGFVDVKKVDIE